jgi:hypothetical protein
MRELPLELQFGAPGKNGPAVFALYSPRPQLLRDFTKERLNSTSTSKAKPSEATSSPPSEGSSRCFLRSQPRRRLGLGYRPRRDPGAAGRRYHGRFRRPPKTGTFYFARNRNFLLCLDRKIGPDVAAK